MIAAYIMAAVMALTPYTSSGAVPVLPADGYMAQLEDLNRLDLFAEMDPEELAERMPEDIRHLAADVLRICQREGVNAVFIAAVMRWERRPDLHNYFGWMGSDGKLKHFEDDLDCLERVIPLINKLYLTPGGKYYNGATVDGVSIYYNNSDAWREAIKNSMEG